LGITHLLPQQTLVFYRVAEIVDNKKLDEAEKAGVISKRESCSAALIQLIRAGINASPQTRRVVKNFYNANK
jgi:hypothetical protein